MKHIVWIACLVVTLSLMLAACASSATSATSPTSALNGQQIFKANCATCHPSGPPSTTKTQAELKQFIPGHHTGSKLTPEQVAAVAAFIKP